MYLSSSVLAKVPGIRHGFGVLGESIPAPLAQAWEAKRPRWQQVHKIDLAHVQAPGQVCGEVDGLYTRAADIPISVMTADCVPVVLARRDGGAGAAVHAGWRGTRAHILGALWDQLLSQGERPGDWVAAIGPAIGPCCYEVSEELAADFEKEYSRLGAGVAVPRYRHLDLQAVNAGVLKELGVSEVEILRACTRCALAHAPRSGDGQPQPLLHSYRREGGGTRQYSGLILGS